MPDLHGWITQQIDAVEGVAKDATEGPWFAEHPEPRHWGDDPESALIVQGKVLCILDNQRNGPLNADHIALHSPAAVLRRCAADRKILEHHQPQPDGSGFPDSMQCQTCSQPSGDGYQYLVPYPCSTVLGLAEGYGLTDEQLATLDRPEPPKPEPRPGGIYSTLHAAIRSTLTHPADVPPTLRGPNWPAG